MPEASEAEGPEGADASRSSGSLAEPVAEPEPPQAAPPEAPVAAVEAAGTGDAGAASAGDAGQDAETTGAQSTDEAAASGAEFQEGSEAGALAGEEPGRPPETEVDEAEAGPAGVKRKRRRRKKRKGDSAGGELEAEPSAEHGEARGRRRDAPAPLARFFLGAHAGRKHGFAVGEVVAGRVKEVAAGCITVDLFGKALAYADEFEPREAPPPVLEPPPRETLVGADAGRAGEAVGAAEAGAGAATAEAATNEPTEVAAESAAEPSAPPQDASEADSASVAEPSAQADAAAPHEPPEAEPEPSAAPIEAPFSLEAGGVADVPAGLDGSSEAGGTLEGDGANDPQATLEADGSSDAEASAETTLNGEAAHGPHGPLPAAPVVPDSYPRLEPPGLGQVFRGRVGAVSESGHIAIVNRDVDRAAVLASLQQYRDERRRVQGLVFGFNRGGFDVLVEGVRAFCPASAMTFDEIEDPAALLGQKLEFLLPASQQVSKDIVVSRRSILERLQRKKAKELVRSLEPGQRLEGRVTQVREFGLFVDIGGVEGLVHQSELSFAHGVKPADVAAVGDEIEVQVLRVGGEPRRGPEGGRRDRVERVSLSIKALLPNPWDAYAETLKEGGALLGKVTRTTEFGAFVELAPQVEGLLHITELGRDLKHANQAVREGDELPVVIERLDKRARRISLSKLTAQEYEEHKAGAAAGEEAPRNVRPGSRIKVKVSRVEGRGLLVRVSGVLGKRARGYVPSSELVGERGDLRKAYPVGSELEVKVVGLDRDGGLRCSPKALQVDEERRAVKDYRREAAKQGFGTFGDLLRAKLGQADSNK